MATTTTKKPAARKATAAKKPAAKRTTKATTAKKATPAAKRTTAKKATGSGIKANCPLCGYHFAKPKYKCGNRKACEARQAEKRSARRGRKVA